MYYYIAAFVILFVLALMGHASLKYKRDCVRNIPGPFCVPLVGAVQCAFGMTPKNIFNKLNEYSSYFGNISRLWIFNRLAVFSSDFELNEQILTSSIHITKHRTYNILNKWLGFGLLLSDGTKWQSRRKIITPTFHFKILEEFLEVFDQQSMILIDCLEKKANGEDAFNVYPFMCSATLDIIAETAMGTKVNAQTDDCMQYTSAVNEMTDLIGWRFMRPFVNNELIFSLLHPFKKRRIMKLTQIMHQFTRNVIEERRAALAESLKSKSSDHQDPYDIGVKKRVALLDVLLQATLDGKPLTNEDIREEVDTFMFEGHDTTAASLSFTLHLLARHPQVQNKLLAEIRQVYGDPQATPFTIKSLNELKYMECVIRESLRLYPPISIIAREIKQDFKYKHSRIGDGIIPAGSEFIIVIRSMLNNPTRFENPREFIPERHEKTDVNSAFSFIPFSAGPRNCIGQKYALYEMKVVLVNVLRAYELLPLGQDVEPLLNIVLRSSTGMQLGMRKRLGKE